MKPRVLVVDHQLPTGPADAGSVRMARIVELLAAGGFDVTAATDLGTRVDYEVVILSRPETAARWLDEVRRAAPAALVVFDTVDLHHLREFRQAKLTGSASLLAAALARKRQELALVAAADRTLVVSEVERELLAREVPGADVHVVSNIHPVTADVPPFEARSGAVFVGAFEHQPNVDAAEWLVDEIWPLVRAATPIDLTIVGRSAPAHLARACVSVAASVPDVAPYIDAARLSVAPLRFGAGVKGKVLESLGRGTPVVGTGVAFEGIPVEATADDAAGLAAAIVEAHEDRHVWTALSDEGRRVVAESFSADAARRALTAALRREAVHV
jgi:O-antigen biosynthesis protein